MDGVVSLIRQSVSCVTERENALAAKASALSQKTEIMLIPCPECGTEVSEKAPTCPKCGAVITYPAFYGLVESDGLNIKSLMWGWLYGPLENEDTTAYGCGQGVGYLRANTDDEEMLRATLKAGSELGDAMRTRLAQISKNSAEANELKLTVQYVQAVRDFAALVKSHFHGEQRLSSDRIKANIDLILRRLEAIKASCKRDDDVSLIDSEIEECRKFEASSLTTHSNSQNTPTQSLTQTKSGCLSLIIALAGLAAVVAGVLAFAHF